MAIRTVVLLASLCVAASDPADVQVDGSGTTNPSKFFWQIMEMIQARSRGHLKMTYRAVGSSNGQREFTQNPEFDFTASANDFAAGDIPMSSDRYDSLTGTGSRQMVHVPFCLGAIAIFHSIPPAEVGNDGLKLSPCLLAKIFSGKVTVWSHADVIAENPNLKVADGTKIEVGHRAQGSSSTTGLSGYLNSKCTASWGLDEGSTIAWPDQTNFHEVQGSPGMTDHIAGKKYAIGYLDAGHGHQRGFLEASLQNQDGNYLTSLEAIEYDDGSGENGVAAAGAAAFDAGDIPSDPTVSWANVNLYSKAGPKTWPIVLVSYIYLLKDMSAMDGAKVGLIKAFVDMVTGPEGQALLPDYSFNAIPADMNKWTDTWNTHITKPGGVVDFTTEDDTTAWTGQGDNVISSKRNSYSLWKLNELSIVTEALEERVKSLETALDDFGIVALHGSGTTNPKNWFAKAMKLMEVRARAPLHLSYRAVGSSSGQREFIGNADSNYMSYNHFGAGDIPMSQANFDNLRGAGMVHIPFALGAIAVFHSVPANEIGGSSINLNACLLARIFGGDITEWDHEDIKKQNDGLKVPVGQKIMVGHRKSGSSSTGGITGYLDKKCSEHWSRGAGSTITWPNKDNFKGVEGSPGMQEHIQGTPYAIGYLDAGHGHDLNFGEVALTNKNGETRTSKESIAAGGVADAGAAGVQDSFPTDPTVDWSLANLYDMAGANTWPIVLVSYLYVRTDQTMLNPKSAAALKAFIKVIIENHDNLGQEFGFTVPGSTLRQLAMDAAALIVYPAGTTDFHFESDKEDYIGMGKNVISSKRNSYDIYEDGVLENAIRELQDKVTNMQSAPSNDNKEDGDSMVPPLVVAIIALVISIIASIPGCLAFKKLGGGRTQARDNGMPPSTVGLSTAA